ncbi:MAG TPA: DUF6600 domain-containing protein, partial [Labilithrix sp.]|nr:DUF6600 domain-containing protein [Labilithrix sp.]
PSRTVAATWRELGDEEVVGISTRPPVRRAPPEFDDADPDAVRLFFDVLAPYGTWLEDPRLGFVWIPSNDKLGPQPFVPYGTHGRWTHRELAAVTGSGERPSHEYVWVSDLPWGWVTFHYGRWAFAGDRGWAWIAGRRYSGAWVDWRVPHGATAAVVGWGPTPPAHIWRIAPGPRQTRARLPGEMEVRDARVVSVPFVAFATPYAYARAGDLFHPALGDKLMPASAALGVAHATVPAEAPSPALLGCRRDEVPAPPAFDRGLQQAWMLATPATASAVGAGPALGAPPRLRTWVAGGARYSSMH